MALEKGDDARQCAVNNVTGSISIQVALLVGRASKTRTGSRVEGFHCLTDRRLVHGETTCLVSMVQQNG